MRIRWTETARRDLRRQIGRIAEDRPKTAAEVARRIRARVRILAEQPRSGRVVPEFETETLREVVVQSWRIVYRLHPEEIVVVRVWHVRRDLTEPDLR